jgi:hypothetical protein
VATRAQIRTKVRRRADQEQGTGFVPDTEVNDYVNDSLRWVYSLLVRAGVLLPKSTQTVTASGASPYALATTTFVILGVYRVVGNQRIPLSRLQESEYDLARTLTGAEARIYDVTVTPTGAPTLVLYPNVSSGTYEVRYVPAFTDLTSDVDVLVWPYEAEELVVVDAAIKCAAKEGQDVRQLTAERARLEQLLYDTLSARDATQPGAIQDTARTKTLTTHDGFAFTSRGVDL